MGWHLLGNGLLVPEPSASPVPVPRLSWLLWLGLGPHWWEELAVLCPTHTLPWQFGGCKPRGRGAGDTPGSLPHAVMPGAFPQAAA